MDGQIEGTATTAFGKYQLFASLGRGGMADVFLSVARGQMGFNKLAVIKRLRQALAEEAAFRNMFLDEARLAARLNHPNIVHTYEVGEQNGVYFIAMEYLEGHALNKVVKEALRRKESIEPEIAVRIVADALAGLGHAHELRDYDGRPLQIIHRDISPHNIFVTYDGHTKLVDFGIAKAALSSTETEVGVLKGKVAYMSPEQAMGARIDARSDLFAMGIVLWELLAHQRLMTGENAANTLHKLMNEPIPRLSQVLPGVDPMLDAIVTRSLEKDPNVRFSSAAEMREALEGWLAARPRPARQEDVARKMVHLFGAVREEVQRQINRHMSAFSAATSTQELQALTAEALRRMEQSGANVSGQLLRLGGSGSGSGVIASYGGLPSQPSAMSSSGYPAPPGSHSHAMPYPGHTGQVAAPPAKSNSLAIVIAIGFFVLATVGLLVFGMRRPAEPAHGTTTATPPGAESSAPPSGSPSAATSQAPSAQTSSTTPPPADTSRTSSTEPTATTHAGGKNGTKAGGRTTPVATVVKTSAPAPPPPPPPAEDPGFLTISSYPWAKVYEGGRLLCTTPCAKVSLPAGSHNLVLENPDQGLKQSLSVSIKSGETTTRQVGFK